ncbi:unannotated protein [freshwater metagenome]|uniref:Unannotated protein n=1 Tax=freshwater metagenome TaxID=449393 RepID=A0A6J6X0P3_9ZZZZ
MRVDQAASCGGGFGHGERINHDPTGVGAYERDVRDVVTTNLVDAVGDFEQAVQAVDLRLAPQAGVGLGWRIFVEELVRTHVPQRIAEGAVDHWRFKLGKESL